MSHAGGSGGSGGREDCWSDGGTACLVDAWGARYLQLNRGSLRQKDWSDVAGAVNRRQEILGRPRRTDVQCKNRIDTVKKKYKLEKSKPLGTSQWPLFPKLDALVGPPPPSSSAAAVKKPPVLTFTVKPRNPNPSPNSGGFSGRSSRFQSRSLSESSLGENDDGFDDDGDDAEGNRRHERFLTRGVGREKRKWEGLVGCERGRGGGGEMGELARAIVNFAEVYERVETSKQQQMMQLERHRMELAKELEFQRMKMFVEAQIEIEKMKMEQPKYSSGSGEMLDD